MNTFHRIIRKMRPEFTHEQHRMHIFKKSDEFFSKVDLSLLADFTVGADLLRAVDLAKRSTNPPKFYRVDNRAFGTTAQEINIDLSHILYGADNRVYTELSFWWKRTGDAMYKDSPLDIIYGADDFLEQHIRLGKVVAHPHLREYFRAGVWDVSIAESAYRNDVDVELALS